MQGRVRRSWFALACVLFGALALAGATGGRAVAQAALAAAEVDLDKLPPEAHLVLRPDAGLEALAAKVARVLALRTGMVVEIGEPAPSGLLEAVPAGHLALARADGEVRLSLGAAFGRSFSAVVQLADDQGESDVRSVALAVETLRDRAIEARARLEPAPVANEVAADGSEPAAAAEKAPQREPAPNDAAAWPASPARDDGALALSSPEDKRLRPVQPYVFLRAYGGASPQSTAPRMGVGGGGGLCVLGHCLVLAVDYPVPFALEPGAQDIRYRYTTFTSGFYSRPWTFGGFTPAASVSFLSRIGYFERDMGLPQQGGLDTDLGVRATLEAGYQLWRAIDAVGELGLDYALDRWRLGHGDAVAYRGERLTPWFQAGIRVRPY